MNQERLKVGPLEFKKAKEPIPAMKNRYNHPAWHKQSNTKLLIAKRGAILNTMRVPPPSNNNYKKPTEFVSLNNRQKAIFERLKSEFDGYKQKIMEGNPLTNQENQRFKELPFIMEKYGNIGSVGRNLPSPGRGLSGGRKTRRVRKSKSYSRRS